MTGMRAMVLIVVMALLCMAGLAGMLVAGGIWDIGFFGLAALSLLVGAVCIWRKRDAGQ